MRKIRALDNVYDLITINMEDRFKDNVAFRFYDTANDAVTTIPAGSKTSPGRYVILSGGVVMEMPSSLIPPPAPPPTIVKNLLPIFYLHADDVDCDI